MTKKQKFGSATEGKTLKTPRVQMILQVCFVLRYEPFVLPRTAARELSDDSPLFHRMSVYTRLHRIKDGPLKVEPSVVGETI
jgi:hypothetical protein